jgi:hypothetical protein
MSEFPLLKTGAVGQYPLERRIECSTEVLRFMDGGEQRFREYSSPLHRWLVRLDLLDDEEMARIEEFFGTEQGRSGSFTFTDPWDGSVYPSCSLDSDLLDLDHAEPERGRTMLIVRENRS